MIFEDPSRKRWKVILRLFIIVIFVGIVLLAFTTYSFIVNSPIPTLSKINQEKGKALKTSIENIEKKELAKVEARINLTRPTKKETLQIDKIAVEKGLPRLSTNTTIRTAFLI